MRTALWMAALLLSLAAPRPSAAGSCIDLALVLAVDGSGSVDQREYAFQISAIASAFRSPEVLQAIGKSGKVTISVVFWGDADMPPGIIDWMTVDGIESGKRLASLVQSHRRTEQGDTGLGSGLWSALDMLDRLPDCAVRKMINVSGDGRETPMSKQRRPQVALAMARQRAAKSGVTINGLVISNEDRGLYQYYLGNVIVGRDAFVMEIADYAAYQTAIRRKLTREISPAEIARQ
jgi:hypothetical protein